MLKKVYTIFKIAYVMFLISHYFGCWFYLIDQTLIDNQKYGDPATNYLRISFLI